MPRLLLVIASAVLLSLSACTGVFTIGGKVTGLAGVGLVLQNNGGDSLAISANGTFTFATALKSGQNYAVTVLTQPTSPAQTCTVSNGSGKVTWMKIANVTVDCVSTARTIGGAVTGLAGTGLVLQNHGGDDLPIANDGPFTFATTVNTGAAYAVTVLTQPSHPTQNCQVTNGSNTVGAANVTDIAITCTTSFSGVAAVGSPLAGSVSVRDALGVVRSTLLGGNGDYSIDVSGMTAPFVFRAEGQANGQNYTVYSAATEADLGGTINITQLTDLVVDNIAGQVASDYYNNGDFSSLTPAALDAEVAILKERLLPVLLALGVDASIDLLRSRFTPLSSALDTALDILRVTLDTATNIATITNITTQQAILDDITVPAQPGLPVLPDPGNLPDVAADIAAIRQAIVDFSALFADGLPSVGSVEARFTETFLYDDRDRADLAADLASDPTSVGFGFTEVHINSIDYDDPTQTVANVDFTVVGANNIEQDHVTDWKVVRGSDGIWRFHGNQHVFEIGAGAFATRTLSSGCTVTGLSIGIEDLNSTNNGGAINHIMVFGPALPAAGLRYEPSPFAPGEWINTEHRSGYVRADSCSPSQPLSDAAIAAIPDNAKYVFVAYTSSDNSTPLNLPGSVQSGPDAGRYSDHVERRPLTLAEVMASTGFATFTAPTAAAFSAYVSGPLTVTLTGLNPDFFAYVQVHQITANGISRSVSSWRPPLGDGTLTVTLSLTPLAPGDSVIYRNLHVQSSDAFRRTFTTVL